MIGGGAISIFSGRCISALGGGEVAGSDLGQTGLVVDNGVGLQNIRMGKVAVAIIGVREA